ncbi:MAG: polysaccharide export protein [Deltaproteobacteria bacterium]|nr:MAG: polysaccharide export protein [Deltaproteobacteria bacterium]
MPWVVAALVVLVFSCRPEAKPVNLPPPIESTSIGAGDVFVMHIVGEDELPSEYTVAPDGTVDIPYIHRISVKGLQPQEISDVIRGKLIGDQILTDPSVIVSIKAYNSKRITVGGEVKDRGSFPFEPGMTVADAIVQAGGMTSLSKTWSVILLRKTRDGKKKRVVVDYDAITNNEIPDVPLQAGDKITVPQRAF